MKGFCLAHSFLSHDRLYKLYVLRTVPTVFSVQLSNYISRCDEFVGEVNSELEPFVLYFRDNLTIFFLQYNENIISNNDDIQYFNAY